MQNVRSVRASFHFVMFKLRDLNQKNTNARTQVRVICSWELVMVTRTRFEDFSTPPMLRTCTTMRISNPWRIGIRESMMLCIGEWIGSVRWTINFFTISWSSIMETSVQRSRYVTCCPTSVRVVVFDFSYAIKYTTNNNTQFDYRYR